MTTPAHDTQSDAMCYFPSSVVRLWEAYGKGDYEAVQWFARYCSVEHYRKMAECMCRKLERDMLNKVRKA
jgi:hypothetical protein